jgi:hypothetical protein
MSEAPNDGATFIDDAREPGLCGGSTNTLPLRGSNNLADWSAR